MNTNQPTDPVMAQALMAQALMAPAVMAQAVRSETYTPNRKQQPKKYVGIQHHIRDKFTGKMKISVQVIRHKDGFDLPAPRTKAPTADNMPRPMGAKQLAKLAKRKQPTQ